MKNTKLILMALAFAISFALTAQDKMSKNIDNSNVALEGYSPVSYLNLGLAQKGKQQFKSEYQKVVYYFTSADQKTTFDANPTKFLPQYGGYCAFGIYAGAKFRVNPTTFTVKDGKYYLFLTNLELDAKQLWMEKNDHKLLKSTADKNWKKLSKTYN
jgi:YHS domain-containing protein